MERSHHVVVTVDKELLLVGEDHFAATVLRKENSVANLHHGLSEVSVLEHFAGTASDNSAEVESLFLAAGEDDAALCFGDGLGLLDNDAVEQGSESFEREHF